jgi:uncharacterized repeat protein (TIGR01451 family)
VTVSDPTLVTLTCTPSVPVTLDPGASVTCTGTYTVDQDDLDGTAPALVNVATASATGITASDTVVVPFDRRSAVSVTKSSTTTEITAAGQQVPYTIVATNTGNMTLTGVTVSDPTLGTLTCTPTVPATLAPGASVSCTGSETVSQADLDAGGGLVNTASAQGTVRGGATVTDSASVLIPITQSPSMSVTKSSSSHPDADGDGVADDPVTAPGVIDYTIEVENTGNVTLAGVVVADTLLTLDCSPATLPTDLAPGDSVVCTGSFTVTQDDIDRGVPLFGDPQTRVPLVLNIALAADQGGNGNVIDGDFLIVPIERTARISVAKTADVTELVGPGPVTYTVVVTNTGNTTVTSLVVADPNVASLSCGGVTSLAPGASVTCTGVDTVTQADIDAGSDLVNTATASGVAAGGPVSDSATVHVPVAQTKAVGLTKTSATTSVASAGTRISYTLVASNVGNTTVSALSVSDPMLADLSCGGVTSLAPGASVSCSGTYTVTQADIDGGGDLVNTATASGTAAGTPVSATATFDIVVEHLPAVTLTKTPNEQTFAVGTVTDLTWRITVTNTGNATLTSLEVGDELVISDSAAPIVLADCARTFTNLAPGASQSFDCTVRGQVIKPGEIANVAVVVAASSLGRVVVSGDVAAVRSLDQSTPTTPTLPPTGATLGASLAMVVTLLSAGAFLLGVRRRQPWST